MGLFFSYAALVAGAFLIGLLVRVFIGLVRVDRLESKKSAARVSSIKDALLGRARTMDDWLPDARVKGGMVFNKRANRLEVSGRLSDDSFARVFKR